MKKKLNQLKAKKYVATIMIALLFVFVLGLIFLLKPVIKNIKVDEILTKTTALRASVLDGVTEDVSSNNYDEIKYQIKVNKDKNDQAVIVGKLTDRENKYARFKEINEAEVTDNGKTITISTKKSRVTVTVIIENAPYGSNVNPDFTINSEDENNSKINVDPVVITGKSVEGKVMDEKGTLYNGLEVGLSKNGEIVKKTYTKSDGDYVLSLGDIDSYELTLDEEKYRIVRFNEQTTDENRRVVNIVIEEVEPFSLNIKKTINKLDLVVNGKKETYEYDNASTVVRSIKNAKTIEGSIYYNISIKNNGEIKGTLTALKDIIPEGLSFDESKNPGWTKEGNTLFYTVLEGKEIEPFEKKNASLILDIVKTNEAKNYINKAIANGEDYKYVAYYLNNRIYREEYVVANEKIENLNPNVENFGGWYTDREYTNKYNFNNAVTKDLVLFGKINNNKYSVTFVDVNPNNGDETILDIKEVMEGNSTDLVDAPEYNGYTFKCFDYNDRCYEYEEIIEDTVLYTKYDINTYTINYNLDGGTVEEDNPEEYTVNDEFTLNKPFKEGYTFTGWSGTNLTEEVEDLTIERGSIGDREYTANYVINRSTLTINPNGGTYEGSASSVSYTEDYGTIIQISKSEKRGYTFSKYTKTGGGSYNNLSYTFNNDDATLDAVYDINTYTITYDNITDEERTYLNNKTEYNVETDTFRLKEPVTRKDAQGNNSEDFIGWKDENGVTSVNISIEKGSIGNRKFTAVWKENEDDYKIRYTLNGGIPTPENPETYKRGTATFTLVNPTKRGYNFTGWTGTGLNAETKIVTIQKGSSGDRHYEAHYSVINYDITYHMNGGTSTPANPTTYNVESNSITLTAPTKTGYTFTGWSGTDIQGKSLSVTIPTNSIGDREYTANFDKAEYSLTYTLNGGDYESGKTNPTKYSIESDDITLNNPHKAGYTFKGWSGTDLTGDENTNVVIPHGSIGHRNFLANYTPITYHITYDYNGGTLAEGVTNPAEYTIESDDITFNSPSKEGYTFKNYKVDSSVITTIPTGSIGDKHLVADYEIEHYTVKYYNGETLYASDPIDWNTTTTKPETDPTKAHHIFLYWSEDGVNEFNFSTLIRTNKNLYAVYEEVIAPKISISPTLDTDTNRTWVCGDSNNSNCGVTVTVTSEHSEYELYYKIGDGEATLYTEPFKVYENVTITAFSKKSNIYSETAEDDIVNVDNIGPTINNPGSGAMSFNMTVSGTAQDAGSGVKKFTLYVKESDAISFDDKYTYETEIFDGIKDHAENYDHTFYDVNENTEYIVKIVAEDYVGNISEREIIVVTHPYVARVVGKNGILWYTVDPDTKEIIQDRDFLMYDSIQSAIDYCANEQCTIQTNPILPVVNESVTIGSTQNITIDLDGRTIASDENVTIVNNGKLQVVDRNPRLNDQNEHDSIGYILNTTNKAIINNDVFILGEGSNESSEVFVIPELDRPIIQGKESAVESNNLFYFFDGKLVADTLALVDNGEEPITQYSYNLIFTGEKDKKIGTLDRVRDPEARIKSTYYAKLKTTGDNAFDSAESGTISTENAKLLSKIKQYGDFGFVYDEVNDLIYSGNTSTAATTAMSYLKLDLTKETEKQFLLFDAFADTYGSNTTGVVSISEAYGDTGTEIYKIYGNDVTGTKMYMLDPGKVYYIYFKFAKGTSDINPSEKFVISNFRLLGEKQSTTDFKIYDDYRYASFRKQTDGSIMNNNVGATTSTAHSYIIYDLRDQNEDVELILTMDYKLNRHAQGWVYLSNSMDYQSGETTTGRYAFFYNKDGATSGTGAKVVVPLKHGEINYLHFGFYNYYNYQYTDCNFKITGISLNRVNPNYSISVSPLLNNDTDSYHFRVVSTWDDLSENDHDAIIYGAEQNEAKTGIEFDGNDYVSLGQMNNEEFTWETSFTADTLANATIMANYESGGLGIRIYDGVLVAYPYLDGGYKNIVLTDTPEIGTNYKVTVTYDGEIFKAYLNGEFKGSYEGTFSHPTSNTILMLGADPGGSNPSGSYFNGTLYTAKVYDRALTSEEIASGTTTEGLQVYLNGSSNVTKNSYTSTNKGTSATRSHSYLEFDLTNSNEDKYLYVNTRISSWRYYDYGYVQLTNSPNYPSNSTGRYLSVSGGYDNQWAIITLPANTKSYLHFMYVKDGRRAELSDEFVIKEVTVYDSIQDAYSMNDAAYSSITNYTFEKPIFNEEVDTIEILKDITLNATLTVPQEKEVILDLNGFTLTSNKEDPIIKNNGKLTIIDSDYTDKVKANVDYKTEQARLFEEAKAKYLADVAEYEEYAGLCENCEPSDEYKLDHLDEYLDELGFGDIFHYFDYVEESDKEQEFTAPLDGNYKIEIWGAQGGHIYRESNGLTYPGGYGAYSTGTIELSAGDKLYINVGGAGTYSYNSGNTRKFNPGGYNGGGNSYTSYTSNQYSSGSGGGATHIATVSGELKNLSAYKDTAGDNVSNEIIIVSGGGGGALSYLDTRNSAYGTIDYLGSGGGVSGVSPLHTNYGSGYAGNTMPTGGTQSTGGTGTYAGTFGSGSTSLTSDPVQATPGGGGGWFGGASSNFTGASGGSGYIANPSLIDKHMYCYDCEESTEESTYTISEGENSCHSADPLPDCAKEENGYAKITILTDEYVNARSNLEETYEVKSEPVFTDYLRDIDFDSSIDVEELTIDSEVSYNDMTDENMTGSITTTIGHAIVNEEHAILTLKSGNINVNVNSKIGVINRGLLNIKDDISINANNASSYGVYNETNGDIESNGGVIKASGSSSMGLLNRSSTPLISNLKIITGVSNAVGIYNQASEDVTFSKIDISGSGIGFEEIGVGNTTINAGNIISTANYSVYVDAQHLPNRFVINNSNLSGTFSAYATPKLITVNYSTLTSVDNRHSNMTINNSSLSSFTNWGQSVLNKSTITTSGTAINNWSGTNNSWNGIMYDSSMIVNDSTIKSTATSAVTVISNSKHLIVNNTEFINMNNVASTAISNGSSAYVTISGNTIVPSSFGTVVSNSGVTTIGVDDKNTAQVYDYPYTGKQEEFTAPADGYYKLETWGASGSPSGRYGGCATNMCVYRGGFGAYASGVVYLREGEKLYVHVGEVGMNGASSPSFNYYGSYNGGGINNGSTINGWASRGSGGGATDISLSSEDNTWYYDNGVSTSKRSQASYEQRLIVAGGGGVCPGSGGCYGGYPVTPSSSRLGYGNDGSGGGYYGGTSYTGGSSYVSELLSDPIMKTGNEEMPDYTSSGLILGNYGSGYAKITQLGTDGAIVSSSPSLSAVNYGVTGTGRLMYFDGTITAGIAVNGDIDKVQEDYDIYKTIDSNSKEKMILVANADSRPVESGEEFVAAIGNAKYTTIQNAIDASNNGDKIDLLVDIEQQNTINVPSEKQITIDYNGHTVRSYNSKYLYDNLGNLTITDNTNTLRNNTFNGDKYIKNSGTLKLNKIAISDNGFNAEFIENNDGVLTLDGVKLTIGSSSGTNLVSNTADGTITVKNSTLSVSGNRNIFKNAGTITLEQNTIACSNCSAIVTNTGTATLDNNNYSVSGSDSYGRYLLYSTEGTATIKNTNTQIEDVYNTAKLTLINNDIPSGTITSSGLTIIESGTYNNTFNISGAGLINDNTENKYSLIMHTGTLGKKLNISSSGLTNIESGSIIVGSGYAIENSGAGIINLGIKDGNSEPKETTKPIITGGSYGIYTSNPSLIVNFYDGIVSAQKSYNVTIEDVESGYSVFREYDSANDIETKYLTNEPMFINVTQNIEYADVNSLNNAISSGLVDNNDVIRAYRNITLIKNTVPINIPSGLSLTFDLNGKIIDKNNPTMFTIDGELNAVDNVNDSAGVIDSTIGNIFVNNGTLNIISGKYTSEKDANYSEIIVNNDTLNVSGGTLTKYHDSFGYVQTNSGAIITNNGNANITGGKYYTSGTFVETYYRRVGNQTDYIYSSAVFVNTEDAVLTVTGGAYDGYSNQTWYDYGGYYRNYSSTNKGELIYNDGIATFNGVNPGVSHIGKNTGTLTFDTVIMSSIVNINKRDSDNGTHSNLINTGTLNIVDSEFTTYTSFLDNSGGTVNITNSIIDKISDNGAYRSGGDDDWSGIKNSHTIRNYSSENGVINITNSHIYNKGNGEVIDNASTLNITNSTIESLNNNGINTSGSYVTIKNSSISSKGSGISTSSGTIDLLDETSVISSGSQGIYTSGAVINLGRAIGDDTSVSTTYPLIKGGTYGINNSNGTINFYDGILMGKTNPISGIINNIELGYMIVEDVDGEYKTNYLDRVPVVQNITQATELDPKKYYDLATAFAETHDGDRLKMISNYSNLPSDVAAVNNSENIIFDLNGKFIRQTNSLLLTNNGSLTIVDSDEDATGDIKAISGSKVIDNYGTLNMLSGKISTSSFTLLIKNNTGGTITLRDKAKIISTRITTLIDSDGTLNIYNGAYLQNRGGTESHWTRSNDGVPMIINTNELKVIDFNHDDDESTSSEYDAPWLYSVGNGDVGQMFYWSVVSYYDSIIRNTSTGNVTLYGGIYNNGSTTSPDGGKIIWNSGTATIKNFDSYSLLIGYNDGDLDISNSTLHNLQAGALVSKTGSLNVENTSIDFTALGYSRSSGGHTVTMQVGNATFDHVIFTGGTYTSSNSYEIYLIEVEGPTEIKNSSINAYAQNSVLGNDSVLTIKDTPITVDKAVSNRSGSTLTIDNCAITSSGTGLSNSGTLNLINGSTITAGGTGLSMSGGTANINVGTSITANNGSGISISGGVLNLGEIGGVPDPDSPHIQGTQYGVYRSSQSSRFNFYDGIVIGKVYPSAVYGGVSSVEGEYETETSTEINPEDPDDKTYKVYLVFNANTVAVAKVGESKFTTNSETSAGQALQNAVLHATAIPSNIKTVELLSNVDLVNDEVIVTSAYPVTINDNGFRINEEPGVYYLDSNITVNSNNLGASVSKLLSNVFDVSYETKDIIVYELSDGSSLDTTKIYKLYKDNKLVGLEKEELGKYKYKGNTEKLIPIRGRIYLDNLYKGSYRLESSDNKYIEFSIDEDGNISGNVTENVRDSSSTYAISNSEAELILTLQTGTNKPYYLLLIIPIILIIVLSMIILRKNKKREI